MTSTSTVPTEARKFGRSLIDINALKGTWMSLQHAWLQLPQITATPQTGGKLSGTRSI